MNFRFTGITEGYRERIGRLALFDPLYQLKAKIGKDRKDRSIDYFGLGLLTLLFFFENMLMRNKKTGVTELAQYLEDINQGEIDLESEGFEKLARSIVEAFRPPSGKRNARIFYNWETRQNDRVEYSILKAERGDIESNKQYYSLDEHGLELVFATKEFFREFHLSINQLLLRKQLEKGEFVGVLRQIDEMRIDVESLQERIVTIKHEVQRNIVSEETFQRYKNTIEDINTRLTREHEEFEELQGFVGETIERLGYEIQDAREQRTYDYILRIDRELSDVHHGHTKLLRDSIDLKTTALQAAQESLYYVAIQSFNFNQEIAARLVSSPLPIAAARTLIEPFLYLERQVSWSPLAVFEEQRIGAENETEALDDFQDVSTEEERQHLLIQKENFGKVMRYLLGVMGERKQICLKEVVEDMRANRQETWLDNRSFYDFWLLLHQRTPLARKSDEGENHLLEEVTKQLAASDEQLRVIELPQLVNVNQRFTIQDMLFIRELRGTDTLDVWIRNK